MKPKISTEIDHLSKLANLTPNSSVQKNLSLTLPSVLKLVQTIQTLDTKNIPGTYQVTQNVNVTRADVIDHSRILSQTAALSNAATTHQGYFVYPTVFNL